MLHACFERASSDPTFDALLWEDPASAADLMGADAEAKATIIEAIDGARESRAEGERKLVALREAARFQSDPDAASALSHLTPDDILERLAFTNWLESVGIDAATIDAYRTALRRMLA